MNQFLLTPAAGKRLIGKAMVHHSAVGSALKSGPQVINAGTTNGYVAEEILSFLGQVEGFSRRRFFRGITLPPQPRLPTRNASQIKANSPVISSCAGASGG